MISDVKTEIIVCMDARLHSWGWGGVDHNTCLLTQSWGTLVLPRTRTRPYFAVGCAIAHASSENRIASWLWERFELHLGFRCCDAGRSPSELASLDLPLWVYRRCFCYDFGATLLMVMTARELLDQPCFTKTKTKTTIGISIMQWWCWHDLS